MEFEYVDVRQIVRCFPVDEEKSKIGFLYIDKNEITKLTKPEEVFEYIPRKEKENHYVMKSITIKRWRILKKLTNENILKNQVDTIKQFKVLEYLKKSFDIYEFKVYLFDRNTIKVIDKNYKSGYFQYDEKTKTVIFKENIKNEKEIEI